MRREYQIRWTEREILSYFDANVRADADCLFDPSLRTYFVVIHEPFRSANNEPVYLSNQQIEQIEHRIKETLSVDRFLGIPYRKNTVTIVRKRGVA